MSKHVPELLVESAFQSACEAFKGSMPLVAGRQRLNNNINAQLVDFWSDVRDQADGIVKDAQRRIRANTPELETKNDPVILEQFLDAVSEAEEEKSEAELKVVDLGRFAANITNIVCVPVTMRPYLHESNKGRWSWRTTVDGFSDFRHINVANFHSSIVDDNGNWFVNVDATWKTDQPVFKDFCNK